MILRTLTHSPINAHFSKNADDFVVREVPLYEFSGAGEHLILHIAKKDLSTSEAVRLLSEVSGAKMREFGVAGLKDKQGQTFQYISAPKNAKFISKMAQKFGVKLIIFGEAVKGKYEFNGTKWHF